MEKKKALLSIKDLKVKFHVRGRVLTAIRGVSLDIYENESIAIVGESGSGKSVFTKTFAGMLDSNGFISDGQIIYDDQELADTTVVLNSSAKKLIERAVSELNESSKLELGASIYQKIEALKAEKASKEDISEEEKAKIEQLLTDLKHKKNETYNLKLTLDSKLEKSKINEVAADLKAIDQKIKDLETELKNKQKIAKESLAKDEQYMSNYHSQLTSLESQYEKETQGTISDKVKSRNEIIAKEIYLSIGRYSFRKRTKMFHDLLHVLQTAMKEGRDLFDEEVRNRVFDEVTFRVKYLDETKDRLHGTCVLNLAKIKDEKDWIQIRGAKIATVFQDPMTSLNPIITIGKQITSVIMKHQQVSSSKQEQKRWT